MLLETPDLFYYEESKCMLWDLLEMCRGHFFVPNTMSVLLILLDTPLYLVLLFFPRKNLLKEQMEQGKQSSNSVNWNAYKVK